jgi:hypothetical protein
MLLRLTFYESERRKDVLEDAGLIRVHVFRNRLPMMHRDGWTGNRVSNPTAFAWFVWERGYTGNANLDRISSNRCVRDLSGGAARTSSTMSVTARAR